MRKLQSADVDAFASRPGPAPAAGVLRKHLRKALPALLFSEHVEGEEGEAMFRHACRLGLEGIVSKRATSRYKSGRCLSWVKVKNPGYERR
jgi:ATP-dependent DNA ligase